MTDLKPFRLRVLESLTVALQQVSRTDGPYTYNLAPDPETQPDGAVFRGRGTYGENDPLPMLSILEDPKEMERDAPPEGSSTSKGEWCLLIQGFIRDDQTHPTDPAYWLLADTKVALRAAVADKRNILGLGYKKPAIEGVSIGAGVVRPPDEISAHAYFWIPLRLQLVEDDERPFT